LQNEVQNALFKGETRMAAVHLEYCVEEKAGGPGYHTKNPLQQPTRESSVSALLSGLTPLPLASCSRGAGVHPKGYFAD
jgi:hypothetical protein